MATLDVKSPEDLINKVALTLFLLTNKALSPKAEEAASLLSRAIDGWRHQSQQAYCQESWDQSYWMIQNGMPMRQTWLLMMFEMQKRLCLAMHYVAISPPIFRKPAWSFARTAQHLLASRFLRMIRGNVMFVILAEAFIISIHATWSAAFPSLASKFYCVVVP